MAKNLYNNVCEEQLYAKIYTDFAEDLYKQLYYKYGERLNPKDKVQEAFIKMWHRCADVLPSKARGFLYTTANNLMLNEFKHQKVDLKYAEATPKSTEYQNPEFLLEQKEYLKKYQKALSNLTEAQREAFMLNKVEGKRHAEIAEMLGISRKAVEKRLYGAIKILKEELVELQGRKI